MENHININVYDISGRLVTTLFNSRVSAGNHSVTWDGTDINGLNVATGLYIYTLEAEGISLSHKMMLMK